MRDLSIILALYFTFTRSTSIEFSVLSSNASYQQTHFTTALRCTITTPESVCENLLVKHYFLNGLVGGNERNIIFAQAWIHTIFNNAY